MVRVIQSVENLAQWRAIQNLQNNSDITIIYTPLCELISVSSQNEIRLIDLFGTSGKRRGVIMLKDTSCLQTNGLTSYLYCQCRGQVWNVKREKIFLK